MSSELSKWYHSIRFINEDIGEKNTWDDWHIVPTSRPLVNVPELNEEYIEIAGSNGALDYTEAFTGKPTFKNRTGSWEFVVMNGYQDWSVLYNYFLDNVHGKTFDIVLEDEPEYVYHGRIKVNEWRSEEHWSKIVFDYVLNPFRHMASTSASDWKWNDLTFDSDVYTIYYGKFNVAGETIRNIHNPTDTSKDLYVSLSGDMRIFWYGTTVELSSGSDINTGIQIGPGDNMITFTGNGTVTIMYDRG